MRRSLIIPLAASVGVAIATGSASHPAAAQPTRLAVREVSIGMLQGSVVPWTIAGTETGRLAYVVAIAGGQAVVLDGVVGRVYAAIPCKWSDHRCPRPGGEEYRPPIRFSRDGRRVAYLATTADGHMVAVVDGVEGPAFDAIWDKWFDFTDDSRHVHYVGYREPFEMRYRKQVVVYDGHEDRAYDRLEGPRTAGGRRGYTAVRGARKYLVVDGVEVDSVGFDEGGAIYGPVFADSGRRLLYVVKRHGVARVIDDGRPGPGFAEIKGPYGSGIRVSPDGRHVLYVGTDSADHAVLDGVVGPAYRNIEVDIHPFSTDGRHVAYQVRNSERSLWVVDGVPQKAYAGLWSHEALYLRKNFPFAYAARDSAGWLIVIGGHEGKERFESIHFIGRFPTDGRLVYTATRGGREFVYVEGRPPMAYEQVRSITLTATGRLIFEAQRGDAWHVVVDGVEGPPYSRMVWDYFATTLDGKHVAYGVIRDKGALVVTDGVEGRIYDEVTYPYYPRGSTVPVYTARRGDQWVVVLGTRETPPYDAIGRPRRVSAVAPLESFARRGNEYLRVTIEP